MALLCVTPAPSQGLNGSLVVEMVNNMRALRSETELLLAGKMALVSHGAWHGLGQAMCQWVFPSTQGHR